jgi:hypothetical protein
MGDMQENVSAVYETLLQAMSHQDEVRKPAEAKLKELENVFGFCDILSNIIITPGTDAHAVTMAVICIKVKCWAAGCVDVH